MASDRFVKFSKADVKSFSEKQDNANTKALILKFSALSESLNKVIVLYCIELKFCNRPFAVFKLFVAE